MWEVLGSLVAVLTAATSVVVWAYQARRRDPHRICRAAVKRALGTEGCQLPRGCRGTLMAQLRPVAGPPGFPLAADHDAVAKWRAVIAHVVEPLNAACTPEAVADFAAAVWLALERELKRVDVWEKHGQALETEPFVQAQQGSQIALRTARYWRPVPDDPPFVPLAYALARRIGSEITQGRTLIHMEGPPGSGKSTLIGALPRALREMGDRPWHVARLTSEVTRGAAVDVLAEFGEVARERPGVIVLDESYDTDCRLTGEGLCRSLEVLLEELPKTSLGGTPLLISTHSSTDVPAVLLQGAHVLDLATEGMIARCQVADFLAQCPAIEGAITYAEVAWVEQAFFAHTDRVGPLHLQAYALYRSTSGDYRSFAPSRDAARLYEDNVFVRLPATHQRVWSLVALLQKAFRGSLWRGPLPEWLLERAWALAEGESEGLSRAVRALKRSGLLISSLTVGGQGAVSFAQDPYMELPILGTTVQRAQL